MASPKNFILYYIALCYIALHYIIITKINDYFLTSHVFRISRTM